MPEDNAINVAEQQEAAAEETKSEIEKAEEEIEKAKQNLPDPKNEKYENAIKQLQEKQIKLVNIKLKTIVNGFAGNLKDFYKPEDIATFTKKITESVDSIQGSDLKEKYQEQFGENNYDVIKNLPRILFESPYGTDIFTDNSSTFWEKIRKNIEKIRKGENPFKYKSKFAQEIEELGKRNQNIKDLAEAYKKNHNDFYAKGVIKPIDDIIKEMTGKTLEVTVSETQNMTLDQLNSYTQKIIDQIAEKFKETYGESNWQTAAGWLKFILSLGYIGFQAFLIESSLCMLGQSQSGCFAKDPKTGKWVDTLIPNPYQSLNGNNKIYCGINSLACQKISSSNCCNTCNAACCADIFSFIEGLGEGKQKCADDQCCNWKYDQYGYANEQIPYNIDCQKEPDKCKNNRQNWVYDYKCVNGIGAIENVIQSGTNLLSNPQDPLSGVVQTIVRILIGIIVIYILIKIVEGILK